MRMRGYNTLFPMAFHYTGTPILAFARRIARGDKDLINEFREIYRVPEEVISTFTDPLKIATYFHQEMKAGMKEMGYSIDWRREFTTVDAAYNRFIEWQFKKLRDGGYIKQGTHPVGWCPVDNNAMGQHDTKGDVEPEIAEFTGIKFILGDTFLPTATLRPETVFGVTNLWINPNTDYVKVRVNGENWIIARPAADRLSYQFNMQVVGHTEIKELIGREVENPIVGSNIPILPASFVDPKGGTGIVMSVPAHAPYDYQALKDLEANPAPLEAYGIRFNTIKERLKPISVIDCEGYPDPPAKAVVEKFDIKHQEDSRLQEATAILYSDEYHKGVMKSNAGQYAGLPVREARERVARDMMATGKAIRLYVLQNAPVFCRCGAEVVVKVLENQWFIDYGNPEWKSRAREALASMSILPEVFRQSFEYTIGWLREKACARSSGLGTRLPWDPNWVIEALSDSTIYMAFYILAKYINGGLIRPEQLNDHFFDFVFLGLGEAGDVAESTGIPIDVLRQVREEFEYFYPLDSRHSGLDLITNHLTFFIFNHVAIFPRKHWPRQIVANGLVLMEGQKMSKSLANIIPLRDGVRAFGADPVRLTVLGAADLSADADISLSQTKELAARLQRLYTQCAEIGKATAKPAELELEDRWLLSRLQRIIEKVTGAMDRMEVREAVLNALYILDQDIDWYMKFTAARGRPRSHPATNFVLREVFSARIRMMAPVVPHIAEELWEMIGGEGFVSTAPWPTVDPSLRDDYAEEAVEFIERVVEDARNILRMAKLKGKKLFFYTSAALKVSTYRMLLNLLAEGIQPRDAIKKVMDALPPTVERRLYFETVKKAAEVILGLSPEARRRQLAITTFDEAQVLKHAAPYIINTLGIRDVEVFQESDPNKYDPQNRARHSLPYRPAIYIE
jgi:leucyl-tRNA synthetase